jgi:predicted hotdog family 3-hydroxylacyl-ACP dehydratase
MLDAAELYARLPHAGDMCLLDRILHWDADSVRCSARSHRAPNNPLRLDDALPALCGLEYAAQALALHGTLVADTALDAERLFVVVVRNVTCHAGRLDVVQEELAVAGEILFRQAGAAVYKFSIRAGGDLVMEGQLGLMSPG